jgi:ribokinase
MKIVLNPSPYNERIDACHLEKVSLFIVNEIEAKQIAKSQETEGMLELLAKRYPSAEILLTLGDKGAQYRYRDKTAIQDIFPVEVADTTAAGDTYTGYYLAGRIEGLTVEEALKRAAMASSIAVSRKGASPSIPYKEEVLEALNRVSPDAHSNRYTR